MDDLSPSNDAYVREFDRRMQAGEEIPDVLAKATATRLGGFFDLIAERTPRLPWWSWRRWLVSYYLWRGRRVMRQWEELEAEAEEQVRRG